MDFDIKAQLDLIINTITSMNPMSAALFLVLFLCVWFLPTILAAFFNRKNLVKILVANIPAGLSWAAWGALLVWAFSGKIQGGLKKDVADANVSGDKQ
ncbi:superinfection immunity protein [Pseudoalteromonas aurantia]|nr:superinfection immunity protein [Pseudoalteromonas aurantia]